MSVENTLRKAAKLAKKGDAPGAARLYQEVLSRFPGNATARNGLTALARAAPPARKANTTANATTGPDPKQIQQLQNHLQRGSAGAVISQGKRLAQIFPTDPKLFNLIGQAQIQAGQFEAALQTFEKVARLDPSFAGAHINKATALSKLGRFSEAAEASRAALVLDPRHTQAYVMLGFSLINMGEPEKARRSFERALQVEPNQIQAHVGLGIVHGAAGDHKDALALFKKAQALDPSDVHVLNNLATTLTALGRADEAVETFKRVSELNPDNRVFLSNYIQAARAAGFEDQAITGARKAVALAPENPNAWCLLGDSLRGFGETAAAREAFDKAVAFDPNHLIGLPERWRLETLPLDHPDFTRIAEAVANPDFTPLERGHFALTLFAAYDAGGDEERAMASLVQAKSTLRSVNPYDVDEKMRLFEAMKAQFKDDITPLDTETCAEVPPPHRPVFIVGMPRSGTSLVEQILASHSQVYGAGEIPALESAMARVGWNEKEIGLPPNRETLLTLRRDYFSSLSRLKTDRRVVTDKQPLNFRHLGHALAAMPEAKAVLLRRDPRATCWSIFSRAFAGRTVDFSNDMVDTARMYVAHLDLCDFWMERFPDRITVVPYEALTENQDEETRKLVAAVGLDWEDSCLDFYRTERSVRTHSSQQVRKKMYTGSSEAWRRYEPFLAPMLEALGEVT